MFRECSGLIDETTRWILWHVGCFGTLDEVSQNESSGSLDVMARLVQPLGIDEMTPWMCFLVGCDGFQCRRGSGATWKKRKNRKTTKMKKEKERNSIEGGRGEAGINTASTFAVASLGISRNIATGMLS